MTKQRDSKWRWVFHPNNDGAVLRDVGILVDGTLHNPNGYPEETVRTAVAGAIKRQHERHCESAKKAAITRARRRELKIDAIALKVAVGAKCGPRSHCICCGKGLLDAASIELGIGPECWQHILQKIEQLEKEQHAKLPH